MMGLAVAVVGWADDPWAAAAAGGGNPPSTPTIRPAARLAFRMREIPPVAVAQGGEEEELELEEGEGGWEPSPRE